MLKTNLIAVAGILAAAGLASPAAAQDDERPIAKVRYDDLNLSTTAGRERLDARVRTAVRRMCDSNSRMTLRERAASDQCRAVALRSVELQMAALYNGSTARFASEKPPVVAAP